MFEQFSTSLLRNLWKFAVLLITAFAFLFVAQTYPLALGETLAPMLYSLSLSFISLAAGLFCMCVIDPHVNSRELVTEALKGNQAAGAIFIGRCIILATVLFVAASSYKGGA